MNTLLRRFRAAIFTGISWAIAWAIGGLLIGALSLVVPMDWFFRVFDAPLPAMAIPGFFAGLIFSLVLGIAARHRKFIELSMGKFAVWGSLGGVLMLLIPAAVIVEGGAATILPLLAVAAGPFALFGAVSAAGSLAIARKAESQDAPQLPDSSGNVPQIR